MKSPIRNEERIQYMSDEDITNRLREYERDRDRVLHVGEDERRELRLELERRAIARQMKERTEASTAFVRSLREASRRG